MCRPQINVLHIEDDTAEAIAVREALQEYDINVFNSPTIEGVGSSSEYAGALLDLCLIHTQGADTVREFQERHPYLPVVVLTHSDEADVLDECISLGVSSWVVKDRVDIQRRAEALATSLRKAVSEMTQKHLEVLDSAIENIRSCSAELKVAQ